MSGDDDWLFRIQDMIDAMTELTQKLENTSADLFFSDNFLQKATERYFEIIGEAARFVPKDIQEKYEKIPWKDIIGMRHKISHDYLDVDSHILWHSYQHDFPVLLEQLSELLKKEDR